jgi:hypothetical protein
MDKYYDAVNEYYRELNGGKKCKHCKNEKTFKEEPGFLIFTCGGKKEKCSKELKIELANFIDYNETLHNFQKFIKREVPGKNTDIKKQLEDILKLGKKQIIENNKMNQKNKLISEYNDLKIKTKIEQTKLLNDIYDEDYEGSIDKQQLSEQYFTLNKVLNENYKDILELYKVPQNNYIMINKGKVL